MATSSPAPRIQARPSPPQSYSSELSLAMARLIDRTPDKAAVAGAGGLGVAALAAFFLQSFHPFDVTFMDLSVHMVAVCIVVAVSTLAGDFSTRRKVFHLGIVSLSNTPLFPSKE